jgi:hypothetical protein
VADDRDAGPERRRRIRRRGIEFVGSSRLDRSGIDRRRRRGRRRLAAHPAGERLLEVVDDDRLREYVAERPEEAGGDGERHPDRCSSGSGDPTARERGTLRRTGRTTAAGTPFRAPARDRWETVMCF